MDTERAISAKVRQVTVSHCSERCKTQDFRPEASQTHFNNYTHAFINEQFHAERSSMQSGARTTAPAHSRASTNRSHCGRKRSRRHIPAQANYKQHSQHDTIASSTHRERAISVKVWQVTLQCGSCHAANHKQARFQTRSITKSLEQRHMHS